MSPGHSFRGALTITTPFNSYNLTIRDSETPEYAKMLQPQTRMRLLARPSASYRVLLLTILLLPGGCSGDPLDRQEVSGTVKYKGKLLVIGTIEFKPADGQATGVAATIKDGQYRIDRIKGLSPGNYTVLINAPDVRGRNLNPTGPADDQLPPPKELIPEIYNSKTKLQARVEKGGENSFPFDLEKGTPKE